MPDNGLWVSWYNLPQKDRDVYLKWLHGSYLPRILKRQGVLHAAHYENVGVPPLAHLRHTTDQSVPTGNDYILIVGAHSPHAFTDGWQRFAKGAPSRQDEGLTDEDRRMLALRQGERVAVLSEEARGDGPDAARRDGALTLAPCIQLGSFNAEGCEAELMSWYGDWRIPALSILPGCLSIRKLLSVVGWAKHVVLYEFASLEAREENFPRLNALYPEEVAWTTGFTPKLLHAPQSPVVARRIWPPVKS